MKRYTKISPSFLKDENFSAKEYSELARELDERVTNSLGQDFAKKHSNHNGWMFVSGSKQEAEFDQVFFNWGKNSAFDRYQLNTASKKQLETSKHYLVNTSVDNPPFIYIAAINGSIFFKRKNNARLKDIGGYLVGVGDYFYDFVKHRRPWREYTGSVLVTEQFKALAEENGLTGVLFKPVYELECKGLGERSDLNHSQIEACVCPDVYEMVITSTTVKPKVLTVGEKAVSKITENDGESLMFLHDPVVFGFKMSLPSDGFASTDFQIASTVCLPGGETYTDGNIERDFFLQLIMTGRAISCVLDASLTGINPYFQSKPKIDYFEVPICY